MKTYVINLAERTDRLARMARHLDGLGLAWERVEAETCSAQDFRARTARLRAYAHLGGVLPSLGQVGCYYSHRKIWQKMIDDGISQALILEDDAEPWHWTEAVLGLDLAAHDLDQLRLERVDGYQAAYKPSGQQLVGRDISRDLSWGSAAYVITIAGARKCLAAGRFWFVIDDYAVWSCIYGLRTALLEPPLFRQHDAKDTNIISPYPARETAVRRVIKWLAKRVDRLLMASAKPESLHPPVG